MILELNVLTGVSRVSQVHSGCWHRDGGIMPPLHCCVQQLEEDQQEHCEQEGHDHASYDDGGGVAFTA